MHGDSGIQARGQGRSDNNPEDRRKPGSRPAKAHAISSSPMGNSLACLAARFVVGFVSTTSSFSSAACMKISWVEVLHNRCGASEIIDELSRRG